MDSVVQPQTPEEIDNDILINDDDFLQFQRDLIEQLPNEEVLKDGFADDQEMQNLIIHLFRLREAKTVALHLYEPPLIDINEENLRLFTKDEKAKVDAKTIAAMLEKQLSKDNVTTSVTDLYQYGEELTIELLAQYTPGEARGCPDHDINMLSTSLRDHTEIIGAMSDRRPFNEQARRLQQPLVSQLSALDRYNIKLKSAENDESDVKKKYYKKVAICVAVGICALVLVAAAVAVLAYSFYSSALTFLAGAPTLASGSASLTSVLNSPVVLGAAKASLVVGPTAAMAATMFAWNKPEVKSKIISHSHECYNKVSKEVVACSDAIMKLANPPQELNSSSRKMG